MAKRPPQPLHLCPPPRSEAERAKGHRQTFFLFLYFFAALLLLGEVLSRTAALLQVEPPRPEPRQVRHRITDWYPSDYQQ